MIVFVANTNLLELTGLKSEVDDMFINNATVSGTVLDSAGAEVAGMVWPVSLAYVAGSDGIYRAVLPDGLSFQDEQRYTAIVTADGGADRKGRWEFKFSAKTRG